MVLGKPFGNHDEDAAVGVVLLIEGLVKVSSALLLLCVGESLMSSLQTATALRHHPLLGGTVLRTSEVGSVQWRLGGRGDLLCSAKSLPRVEWQVPDIQLCHPIAPAC
jgi:hypothetical protein